MSVADAGVRLSGLNANAVRLLSFIGLLILWQVAAVLADNPRELPDVAAVAYSFWGHLTGGDMLADLGWTLMRVVAAFVLAMVVGCAVGIAMGLNRKIDVLFDSWLVLFLNIPALVTIILCFLWFHYDWHEAAAILAVALNKFPNVVVTLREGTRAIDRDLLQVAQVFRVSKSTAFFRFFLPQLYPYIMGAARSGVALIWKIVLVVELLGRSNGVGYRINLYFAHNDIASILAYTLAFVFVMMVVEFGFVGPLDRHMTRWRK